MLLHGMLGSSRYWHSVTKLLHAKHRVIAIDLLGFGRSPKPLGAYTPEDHVASLAVTLQALDVKQPFTLAGFSMGSLIALRYAALYPEQVGYLALISPPVYDTPEKARQTIIDSRRVPAALAYGPVACVICWTHHLLRPLFRIITPRYYRHLPHAVAVDSSAHTCTSYFFSLKRVIERQQVCEDLSHVKAPVSILYGIRDKLMMSQPISSLSRCHPALNIKSCSAAHHIPIELPWLTAGVISP